MKITWGVIGENVCRILNANNAIKTAHLQPICNPCACANRSAAGVTGGQSACSWQVVASSAANQLAAGKLCPLEAVFILYYEQARVARHFFQVTTVPPRIRRC